MRILSSLVLASLIACSTTDSLTGPAPDVPKQDVPVPTSIAIDAGHVAPCPNVCKTSVTYTVAVYDQFGKVIPNAKYVVTAPGAKLAYGDGTFTVSSNSAKRIPVRVTLPLPTTSVMLVDPEVMPDSSQLDTTVTVQFIPDLNASFARGSIVEDSTVNDTLYGHVQFASIDGYAGSLFAILGNAARPGADFVHADTIRSTSPNFAIPLIDSLPINIFGFRFFDDSSGALISAMNTNY